MNTVYVLTVVDRDGEISNTVHTTRLFAEVALIEGTGQRNLDDAINWVTVFGSKVTIDECRIVL